MPDRGNDGTGKREDGDFVDIEQHGDRREHGNAGEQRGRDGRPAEPPECLQHHRDDDGLDRIQQARHFRQGARPDIHPGERRDDCHRRKDERDPGHQKAAPAGARVPDVNGEFGGVGPRNQVGGTDEVEERGAGEPPAPLHHLVLHHGNVGGGAPERSGSQLEEQQRQFTERGGPARLFLPRPRVRVDPRYAPRRPGPAAAPASILRSAFRLSMSRPIVATASVRSPRM